ncbi:MAG: HDOD domain-containing protein, partial [Burkholderiaceae bacterium]|nr:HDOD domain-containing protein [Burkholderiaceae bacterium]
MPSPFALAHPSAAPPTAPIEGDDAPPVIARQAIVDGQRAIYGYELFNRSLAWGPHTAASDAALLFNALSHADTEALGDSRSWFINCTHESLAGGHLELIQPEKVVLEVPTLGPDSAPEAIADRLRPLQDLRQRGFRLAFSQDALCPAYRDWLPLAAFIKLDLSTFAPEQAPGLIAFAQAHSTADLVAEKVETQAQFEQMALLGATLFQGYWFAKPVQVQTSAVRPSKAVVLQLINRVRQQASTDEIEELLKKDPTLSFNLLRFINTSGFGLSCEITSFRHAVMILGLKKLFRWAALLLTTSRTEGTSPALGTTAVVRGRLMELLAAELLPSDECDHAFVVGVFSLLDSLLGIPLDKALAMLALPPTVTEALLHGTGVFAPFLELTKACESGEEIAFAQAAEALQLSNRQVNWAHLQALAWADHLEA